MTESRRHILAVGVRAQTAFLTASSAANTGAAEMRTAAAMAANFAATFLAGAATAWVLIEGGVDGFVREW